MNAVAIAYTTDLSRTAAAILVVGPIFDDDDDQNDEDDEDDDEDELVPCSTGMLSVWYTL